MSGEEWFSSDFSKGISQVYKNSSVQSFVDADEYYTDLRNEVEQTNSGDIICWIGFDGGGSTPMPTLPNNEQIKLCSQRSKHPNDTTWFDLLKNASDVRNVAIRILLNLHPSPRPTDKYKHANFDLVTKLNTLKNCNAINDFRYLWLNGTHHQKLVLIYNANKGLMAYTGTCDVDDKRIVEKWCEVQCKIMGDAAAELYDVFQKRYSEHTEIFRRIGSVNSYLKDVSQLKTTAPQSGNFLIQSGTTYGNPQRSTPFDLRSLGNPSQQVLNRPHRYAFPPYFNPSFWVGNDFFKEIEPTSRGLLLENSKQNQTYSFAPNGHTGIYQMIKKAIETTKKFIYLEDQYLVCDERMGNLDSILKLLTDKVKSDDFKKIIIFCTRIDDINDEFQGTGWKHRNNFISTLVAASPSKVEICQYKSKGTVGCTGTATSSIFYIHSKTWIFDDEYLITGSANCNRRGYSHDSELDVGVYDQNKVFVKELRKKIWQKRLNVKGINRSPIQLNELDDFLSAAKFWEKPDFHRMAIENSKYTSFSPAKYPDLDTAKYIEILKQEDLSKSGFLTNDPVDTLIKVYLEKIKIDKLWDLVVDPDGT
jgi:phosphatidylserine/phosphatidylglycerophosphate/cardiolipin synthase-like enzyme